MGLYPPILVLGAIAAVFAVVVGPRRSDRTKLAAYECGIEPVGQRFPIKFYLTAMLFIVFDIEIVFFGGLRVCVAAGRSGVGLEEALPGGVLVSTVEAAAGGGLHRPGHGWRRPMSVDGGRSSR